MREGNKGQCHKFNVKSHLYEGINKEQCHGQVPSPREKVTENNVTSLLSSPISIGEGKTEQYHKFMVKSYFYERR